MSIEQYNREQRLRGLWRQGSHWIARQHGEWGVAAGSQRILELRLRDEGPCEIWRMRSEGSMEFVISGHFPLDPPEDLS